MTATLVELHDGRVVTRCAEDWRLETLARHVMNLPSDQAERDWLVGFERQVGAAEGERLRERIDSMRGAST